MSFVNSISAVAIVFVAGSSVHAATVFFDGTFAPSSWTASTVTNIDGVSSTSVETQQLAGGNGGAYMRIELNLVASAAGGSVISLNRNTGAFYNPSVDGVITSIDYSEDSRNFQPGTTSNVQGSGLLIEQGGKVFIQRNPILVMPNPTFTNWAPNAAPGLLAADLWELTPSGLLDPFTNPDFSASGGVMQLGFWRGASSGNFTGTDYRDAGIDNWRVAIVPGPAGASLLLAGGMAALRRRR